MSYNFPMGSTRVTVLIALLVLFTGCDNNGQLVTEYPPPGSFGLITVAELHTVEAGEYNVDAFVASIFECPPDVACFAPDNFVATESTDPPSEDNALVFADRPSQLDVGVSYLFSVEVRGEPTPGRQVVLLGYAEHD